MGRKPFISALFFLSFFILLVMFIGQAPRTLIQSALEFQLFAITIVIFGFMLGIKWWKGK